MPHFHKSRRQYMLKKSSNKFKGIKRHNFPFFLDTVFILKLDCMIINAFDTIIRDSYAKQIAGKISERVLSLPHSLAVNNPILFPDSSRYLIHKAGFFHGISEFCSEYDSKRFCMHKKVLP